MLRCRTQKHKVLRVIKRLENSLRLMWLLKIHVLNLKTVPLKTGVAAILDNMAVAKNRLENLKKKALKDTDLREFFTECLCELQELNCIERVDDSEMLETPIWYLPYFVTSQAKNVRW